MEEEMEKVEEKERFIRGTRERGGEGRGGKNKNKMVQQKKK